MWVKSDDKYYLHWKVKHLGACARDLDKAAWAYCNRYLTDGFLPLRAVLTTPPWSWNPLTWLGRLWQLLVCPTLLVLVRRWHLTQKDYRWGYQIHDFHKYQPSREYVLAERERARRSRAPRKQAPSPQAPALKAENTQENPRTAIAAERTPIADSRTAIAVTGTAYAEIQPGENPVRGLSPVKDLPVVLLSDQQARSGGCDARPPAHARVANSSPPAASPSRPGHHQHACCGVVCLHVSQFDEFVRKARDQADPPAYVRRWFATWDARYASGDRKDQPIGGSIFDHHRARWNEDHPTETTAAPPMRKSTQTVITALKTSVRYDS